MDVGHQRNTASAPVEFGADGAEVFGLAAAIRSVCATEAAVSFVSVLVIDWIRIGLSPPIAVFPI